MNKNNRPQNFEEVLAFYDELFPQQKKGHLGIEWERFGVWRENKKVVDYRDKDGFGDILRTMVKNGEWSIREEEDGNPITLQRGSTLITTEGDGKPEISGDHYKSLWQCLSELEEIAIEIQNASPTLEWLTTGMHPFASEKDISLAPKKRYETFQNLFSDYRGWMPTYMKAICGAHFNISAHSAEDLIQKTKTLVAISPVLCGAFANSPFFAGQNTGVLCARRRFVFSCLSPGREFQPHNFLHPDFDFAEWISFFFERDMVIVSHGDTFLTIPPKMVLFSDFFHNGYRGEMPTFADIDTHIKTCWVDIRPRSGYLEYRALDTLELPELMAAAAFVKAAAMDEEMQKSIFECTKKWKESEYPNIHQKAWEKGIHVEHNGIAFVDILARLLPLAESALKKINTTNTRGEDESVLLRPLWEIVQKRETPAERFLKERGLL